MNYLAHAFFSFQNPAIQVGNLISDFVKGKTQYAYPLPVQQGIRLHRAIDTFTDSHTAVEQAKSIFRPVYRLYAGAMVDVAFDYFVANDPECFPSASDLDRFAQNTYANLQVHYDLLPDRFQLMFERMQVQNWLYNYRFDWGMEKSFGGVVYRSRYLTESASAYQLFVQHKEALHKAWLDFRPALLHMLAEWQDRELPI